jgi:hypothetical protein
LQSFAPNFPEPIEILSQCSEDNDEEYGADIEDGADEKVDISIDFYHSKHQEEYDSAEKANQSKHRFKLVINIQPYLYLMIVPH